MGPSQYLVEPKALLKNLQIQWAFVHNWGLFLFSFFFFIVLITLLILCLLLFFSGIPSFFFFFLL